MTDTVQSPNAMSRTGMIHRLMCVLNCTIISVLNKPGTLIEVRQLHLTYSDQGDAITPTNRCTDIGTCIRTPPECP